MMEQMVQSLVALVQLAVLREATGLLARPEYLMIR